jgi:DNA-binding transcriptional ArsR family regulator
MDVFGAIAEPNRRTLLRLLLEGERPAGDLVAALPGLSQPAVSRHLQLLHRAGLVAVRVDAQKRIYRLQPFGLAGVNDWLEPYRQFWTSQIESLEQRLKARQIRSAPKVKKKGSRKG